VFAVKLPVYGRIHLRESSMDLDLARLVLVDRAYDLPCSDEGEARLNGRYREILTAGRRPAILNAGGYIGLSALWFARHWPDAEVISVEPDPGNLKLLRRNLNGRPRHTIVEAALGSASGKVALSADSDPCMVQTERSSDGVKLITVEDALSHVPGSEPFICNIDIEGFEEDLFAANTAWIDKFALIII
jgi:FkbM family methyltransferase